MLNIQFANRFETLSDLLVERIGASTGSVFSEDQVIVPSAAIKRRLTLELARRHGICANVRFSYLARWLWQQIGRVVPGVQDESPFDASILGWRVYAAFGDAPWTRPHRRLAAYLEQSDPVMRFELAMRVAGLFDQYITYRPEWLAAWARSEFVDLGSSGASIKADQEWQAAMWRRLSEDVGAIERHPVSAFVQALEAPAGETGAWTALPPSVHVFSLPTMPPLHLGLLQSLARRIDVQVYALNPCQEYWFEVVDRRRLADLAAQGKAEHHEVGHRLLAAWGQQTQSQLTLLVDAAGDAAVDDARFEANPGTRRLARLQNSILDMADLAPGSIGEGKPGDPDGVDRSIEIHVCHSLTREIEVLQDRLLALFAHAGAPALADVLVVTPDLDAAAPLIDAIFGTAPRDRYIPYTITGRARSDINVAARALLDLLALVSSRFSVSSVFALLQQAMVARKFGLAADDLDQVRSWLQAAGVHWALDADHRGSLGVPAETRHSFADGLDRLFLGYALPLSLQAPFDGRMPAGDAEGSDALALGALWCFIDALASLRRQASTPQPASAWPGLLADALAHFMAPRDNELEDVREVRAVLEELGSHWQHSELAESLPVDVVRSALAQALDDPARGGVPTGMVTFSPMSSLRNIPFKVVCAIGLNDGAFPTGTRPTEFDLMALQPRRGDRQRRIDERNVFLDLLLAARDQVHLSYVGRSVRDNSPLPPSVLISELLEYLVPAIVQRPDDAAAVARARASLIVEHPLQPFSEAAFRVDADLRQRSFQREFADALKGSLACPLPRAVLPLPDAGNDANVDAHDDTIVDANDDDDAALEPAAPFFATPLPQPGEEWCDVPLERLIQFFRNPCRYLLERRLGIELRRDDEALQDDEPFLPDVPGRTALARRLLPPLLAGTDISAVRAMALAGTEVPAGAFGRRILDHELAGLQDFAVRIAEATREPCVEPHAVSLTIALDGRPWRIHVGFADLRASGLIRYRYDDLRPMDHLSAWLHHLMLCASPPAGVERSTTWWGRVERLTLKPCDDPIAVIETLLRLYERGLREPLYFFPKSAWSYVTHDSSLTAATQTWRMSKHRPYAEGADAAYRLALRGRPDPLGPGQEEFHACAHKVFDPLIDCLQSPPP